MHIWQQLQPRKLLLSLASKLEVKSKDSTKTLECLFLLKSKKTTRLWEESQPTGTQDQEGTLSLTISTRTCSSTHHSCKKIDFSFKKTISIQQIETHFLKILRWEEQHSWKQKDWYRSHQEQLQQWACIWCKHCQRQLQLEKWGRTSFRT